MRRTIKIPAITTGIACLIIVALLFYAYLHNFHAVIPNQVYRSEQLSQTALEKVIKRYHIKTVINLRGAHPTLPWYQQEMTAANDEQVKHYDFALQSKTLPKPQTLQLLVNTIATAPRPLLIHCLSGVDRSGMASAIVLILNNDQSLSDIKRQVSYRYFVLSNKSVGKQLMAQYETWLQQNKLATSRANFLRWVGLWQ
jgi:protein tyrosine/serine phosphatase